MEKEETTTESNPLALARAPTPDVVVPAALGAREEATDVCFCFFFSARNFGRSNRAERANRPMVATDFI